MPIQEFYAHRSADDSASLMAPSIRNVVPVTSLREFYAPALPVRTASGFQGPQFDTGIDPEQVYTLYGSSGPVLTVAFSPDGAQIAAGSKDAKLRIWNIKTDHRRDLIGHEGMITTIAWSPNSRLLVSGSGDRTIRLWDATSYQQRRSFTGHEAAVTAVAISRGGAHIVSASEDRTVRIWDTATGSCRTVSGQKPQLAGAAFVRDGELVALSSSGTKPSLKLLDLENPGFRFLPNLEAVAHAVAFSPDGKFVAAGLADNTVQWWDTTNDESCVSTGHQAPVFAVACSPDGKLVASGSADGDVRIWNREVTQNNFVVNMAAKVWAVSFSSDGKNLAVGLGNGSVMLLVTKMPQATPANKTLGGSIKRLFKPKT